MRSSLGADQADRLHAIMLHRALKPPRNRKGRPAQAAPSQNQINGTNEYKAAEAAAQRAMEFARRRAAALDHLADHCLQFGMGATAERLSHRAEAIREAVL